MSDETNKQTPPPSTHEAVEERTRMQLTPGYWNSFETVISALEKGGQDAQAAGFIAHGGSLLHAAVELRHVWTDRTKAAEEHVVGTHTAAQAFSRWIEEGPKLAKAAGCYVGITVSPTPSPSPREATT